MLFLVTTAANLLSSPVKAEINSTSGFSPGFDEVSSKLSTRSLVLKKRVKLSPSAARRWPVLVPSDSAPRFVEAIDNSLNTGCIVSIRAVSSCPSSSCGFGIDTAVSDAKYSFPAGSRIFNVNPRSDSNSEKFVSVFGSMFMTAFQWRPLCWESTFCESVASVSLETVASKTLSEPALNSTIGLSNVVVVVSSTPAILSLVVK